MDESLLEAVVAELRGREYDRATMLGIVVGVAQDSGLDWRQTLLFVQQVEELTGIPLSPRGLPG